MLENNFERDKFQTRLRLLCYSLFNNSLDWERKSHEMIFEIDKMLKESSAQELTTMMGGEFSFANSIDEENTKIPFYLYMELIAEVINVRYGNNPQYGNISEIITKFREFREKTSSLPYDEKFDSNKHLVPGIISNIISADGFIRLGTTNIGDKEVVSIECYEKNERVGQRRDGEYVPLGTATHKQFYPCLYQEDDSEYKETKAKEEQDIIKRFNAVTGGYFKDGHIPMDLDEFQNSLKSKEINPHIAMVLRKICENRHEYPRNYAGQLSWMCDSKRQLDRIEKIETEEKERKATEQEVKNEENKSDTMPITTSQIILTDEETTRKQAIKAARKRYSTQNPLLRWWREIAGKQQRFDGIEFEDLSVDEINNLFPANKKGKK